jgi:hypothetical protein
MVDAKSSQEGRPQALDTTSQTTRILSLFRA